MNIGILGGSFDPIHAGHMYLARTALTLFSLDRVLLMPARVPPHKSGRRLANSYHRVAMAALATSDLPNVAICTWELERPRPTYTVETLRHFTSSHPEDSFWFVAGGDSLRELHLWKDCDTLLNEYSFIFFERAGVQTGFEDVNLPPSAKKKFRIVCEKRHRNIQPGISYLVHSAPPPVSSTDIRRRIASGRNPEPGVLSSQVLEYIRKHRLYEKRERDPG